MVLIGFYSLRKVKNTTDFFLAGGNLPWWLAGISHHVSGYSGVVFVGYAAIAYTHGVTIYFWWALPIALGVFVGSFVFAPRWTELRSRFKASNHQQSICKYAIIARLNNLLHGWESSLKLFDVGAKWTALAILLNGFTGVSLGTGILLSGGISLLYISIGGLWADIWTDFAQFVVQIIAGLWSCFLSYGSMPWIWEAGGNYGLKYPRANRSPFHEPYTPALCWHSYLFFS